MGPPGELRYYVKQRPAGNRDLRADTLRCGKVGAAESERSGMFDIDVPIQVSSSVDDSFLLRMLNL